MLPESTFAGRCIVITQYDFGLRPSSSKKAGFESRKAIWLDQGTVYISPRDIIKKFRAAYKGPAASLLVKEMKKAFEAAGRELASGKNSNPNYRRS